MLLPELLAMALQVDGWTLRSHIVWAKKSCMPESVKDRPTNAWESIFLLSKSRTYFYDAEAVMEPNSSPEQLEHNLRYAKPYEAYDSRSGETGQPGNVNNVGIHSRPGKEGRNMRNVWLLGPEPFPGAHFATFPSEIPKRAILAGCPEGGVVLDPFAGSGTTLEVAHALGREAWGIELSQEYCTLAKMRLRQDALPFEFVS